jgi:transcriptional antiterminator NusG
MDVNKVSHAVDFSMGDSVKIVDGPFKDLEGKISEIDGEKGKARVMVLMFGRETSVELDLLQIRKI